MQDKFRLRRRDFLKAAAGVVSGPWIIPSSALGADGHTAPSERLTVASIGIRNMGSNHFKSLLGNQQVQLLAVCDVDRGIREAGLARARETYAERFAKESYTAPAGYNDFRDLMAREDLDAVIIATPDHTHAVISIAAMAAGKDIYVEKPMTVCIQEGRAMANAAARYGRIVQVGSQRRSSDSVRRACELVRNGRIGRLKRVEVGCGSRPRTPMPWAPEPVPDGFDYDLWLGPAPYLPYTRNRCHYNFRFIRDYSGGEMTNFGAHFLDVAQWALGMDDSGPVSIKGTGRAHPDGLYDVFYEFDVEYTYANGVVVHCTSGAQGVKFIGETGWVGENGRGEPKDALAEPIAPGEIHLRPSCGGHLGTFLRSVRTREDTTATVEIGHRSATVCHLGNIAMTLRRTLAWDPEQEIFPDDPEANRLLARPYRGHWTLG